MDDHKKEDDPAVSVEDAPDPDEDDLDDLDGIMKSIYSISA